MPVTPTITTIRRHGSGVGEYFELRGTADSEDGFRLFRSFLGQDSQATPTAYPDATNAAWHVSVRPSTGYVGYTVYASYYAADPVTGARSASAIPLSTNYPPAAGQPGNGAYLLPGDRGSIYDVILGTVPGGSPAYYPAYTFVPDGSGRHSSDVSVIMDGGTQADTVIVPTRLSGVLSHRYGFPKVEQPATDLSLTTADATVTLVGVSGTTHVGRLQFRDPTTFEVDATLTVQSDVLADFLYYDQTYPDMAAIDANARAHYSQYGWREGRDPDSLVSTRGYLGAYGDVRQAGVNPLDHYDQKGWREGRDPSALFSTSLYLRYNPDVAAANVDPLAHYLGSGQAEGRRSLPAVGSSVVRDGFDPLFYALANPDVSYYGLDPLQHWQQHGRFEGRNPDAFFDVAYYLRQNPDVAASGLDALDHYDRYGWHEGRNPSTHFNTGAYLAANPDVAAAGVNPLQHFLRYGVGEGRSGFGDIV